MLHNKKKNWKPFDMNKKPVKQYPFLVPFIWGASWLMTRRFRLKIEKENMEHIRPPYLVLSTHQGFPIIILRRWHCSLTVRIMYRIWRASRPLANGCTGASAVLEREDMFPMWR